MEIINPKKQYHSADNLFFSCQFHILFCPKYRRPIFKDGIDKRIEEIFSEIAEKYKFQIIEMEIMSDHVHLIVDCNPKFGIMECVKKLKNGSAAILIDEYPHLKTQLPNIWTRSAFISTVGSVSLDAIKKYIEDQKGV